MVSPGSKTAKERSRSVWGASPAGTTHGEGAQPGSREFFENVLRARSAMWVRKLVHEDLPGIPLLARLWLAVPQRWLETLGRRWGWYVIARGVKD